MPEHIDIGRAIRVRLAHQGIKQKDFAKRINALPSNVSEMLSKTDWRLSTIRRMAHAVNMTASELVAFAESLPPTENSEGA